MRKSYNTGADSNRITLEVTAGTVGVAHTAVTQRWTGGNHKIIKESNADSGNIPEFDAGSAAELKGSFLVITTVVDFANIPQQNWEQAAKTLSVEYTFDGGFSGHQSFDYDDDDKVISQGGKLAVVTKIVEMQ